MAKSLTDDAPQKSGHNKGPALTQEEREALYLTHLAACRAQDATLEAAMQGVKAIRKARNQVRNLAKADGFPLELIDRILKKEGFSQKDLQREADLELWMHQMAGLPVGGQADLFAATPIEVKDGLDWEAEGYRAGMRATERKPPEGVPPRFHQEWMKGYDAGQERNIWALSEKGRIVDRAENVGAGGSMVPGPQPEEEEDASDPKVADAKAKKLTESGFAPGKPVKGSRSPTAGVHPAKAKAETVN